MLFKGYMCIVSVENLHAATFLVRIIYFDKIEKL